MSLLEKLHRTEIHPGVWAIQCALCLKALRAMVVVQIQRGRQHQIQAQHDPMDQQAAATGKSS